MRTKRRIIFVTDGDSTARRAVEVAARNIGGQCVSAPDSDLAGAGLEKLKKDIQSASSEPIVIMFDDHGENGIGVGEHLMAEIAGDSAFEVLGVLAVASNTSQVRGVRPDVSITKDGELIQKPVGKEGLPAEEKTLKGDTVDIIAKLNIPVIVGIGDPGKMNFADDADLGAPITTLALQEVLRRSGNQFCESKQN